MDSIEANCKHILDYAFYPGSVAVIGASDHPLSFGYHFLRHLIDYAYGGKIYPVNPGKEFVQNIKAFSSLADIPGKVDFVICCVSADSVLPLLDECAGKGVRIVHLLTARLGETGRPQALEMEQKIKLRAGQLGIRLIGPNCMGVYNPSSGIAFGYGFPKERGHAGVVFQSGGAATTLIQNGMLQGLRFSKAVSYGNAIDLDESDLLNYFAVDTDTKMVAVYLEGVRDGGKFLTALKNVAARKPVIIIKGGWGLSGIRAVNTHTGALAGTRNIWQTVLNQPGVVEVADIEEMIDLLMMFDCLPPIAGKKVGIIGGGGGKNVISADLAEKAGLSLPQIPHQLRSKFREIVPDLWDWIGNPVDFSIWGDNSLKTVEVPRLFIESNEYEAIIVQISDDNPFDDEGWVKLIKTEVDNIIDMVKTVKKPLVAVLSGGKPSFKDTENTRWKMLFKQRERLIDAKVPTFNRTSEAVSALNKYSNYWMHK